MLKMLHGTAPGSSPEFWSENWKGQSFEEAVRGCELNPLLPLFNRYLKPGVRFLEGGCGLGQLVAFFTARGVRAVGVDFSDETIATTHKLRPELNLCVGDVTALPFADNLFDVYYSGGVVEHFPAGPEPTLREAYRVLRPGGVLLVSVPYFSPARKVLQLIKPHWKRVASESAATGPQNGLHFYQYVYTPPEFKKRLRTTGFRVICQQGYSILWGLYDIPGFERLVAASTGRSNGASYTVSEHVTVATEVAGEGARAVLKRILAQEDDTIPIAGLLVRGLRWATANMMMYVCVPEKN